MSSPMNILGLILMFMVVGSLGEPINREKRQYFPYFTWFDFANPVYNPDPEKMISDIRSKIDDDIARINKENADRMKAINSSGNSRAKCVPKVIESRIIIQNGEAWNKTVTHCSSVDGSSESSSSSMVRVPTDSQNSLNQTPNDQPVNDSQNSSSGQAPGNTSSSSSFGSDGQKTASSSSSSDPTTRNSGPSSDSGGQRETSVSSTSNSGGASSASSSGPGSQSSSYSYSSKK